MCKDRLKMLGDKNKVCNIDNVGCFRFDYANYVKYDIIGFDFTTDEFMSGEHVKINVHVNFNSQDYIYFCMYVTDFNTGKEYSCITKHLYYNPADDLTYDIVTHHIECLTMQQLLNIAKIEMEYCRDVYNSMLER